MTEAIPETGTTYTTGYSTPAPSYQDVELNDAVSYPSNPWASDTIDWSGGNSGSGAYDSGAYYTSYTPAPPDHFNWGSGFSGVGDLNGWIGTAFDVVDAGSQYLGDNTLWGAYHWDTLGDVGSSAAFYGDGLGLASDLIGVGAAFHDLSNANSWGAGLEAVSDLVSSTGGIFEVAGGAAQGAQWLGSSFTLGGLAIEGLGYAASGDYPQLVDTMAEGALVGSGAYIGSVFGNPSAGAAIGQGVYDVAHWAGSEGPLAFDGNAMDTYFANNPDADGSIGSFIDFAWQQWL